MNKFIYFATLLLLIGITSCQQEDDIKYSCNEHEDAWAKQNLDIIRTMSRSDWLKVENSKKRLIYRAFSARQKQTFWQEKIQKVLIVKDWTPKEYNHITLLEDAINVHLEWFNPKGIESDEKVYDEFKIFAYQWLEHARNELKWSEVEIAAIVATGNDLKIKEGKIIENWIIASHNALKTRGEVECDCKIDNDLFTTCSYLLGRDCRSNECEEIRDCGFITAETCDGICEGI